MWNRLETTMKTWDFFRNLKVLEGSGMPKMRHILQLQDLRTPAWSWHALGLDNAGEPGITTNWIWDAELSYAAGCVQCSWITSLKLWKVQNQHVAVLQKIIQGCPFDSCVPCISQFDFFLTNISSWCLTKQDFYPMKGNFFLQLVDRGCQHLPSFSPPSKKDRVTFCRNDPWWPMGLAFIGSTYSWYLLSSFTPNWACSWISSSPDGASTWNRKEAKQNNQPKLL